MDSSIVPKYFSHIFYSKLTMADNNNESMTGKIKSSNNSKLSQGSGGDKSFSPEECDNSLPVPGLDEDDFLLESNDNHFFVIKKEIAAISKTLQTIINAPKTFLEDSENPCKTNHIKLNCVRSEVLEKICSYLVYNDHYSKCNSPNIPDFVVNPEMALEMLQAASYLDC